MTNFTDSRLMTAAQKRSAFRQSCRFLQTLARDYGRPDRCFQAFGAPLYEHLLQDCSFTAHYNRLGMFSHYFERGEDTMRFIRQFDRRANPDGSSTEYGMCCWLGGA